MINSNPNPIVTPILACFSDFILASFKFISFSDPSFLESSKSN